MKSETEADDSAIRTVMIKGLPIELYKILKLEGLVQSGGEAKHVIAEGRVTVNDAAETRKRKQISSGDRIEFAGVRMRIIAEDR